MNPVVRASFKAIRMEFLCYNAAQILSAEYASGKNYFDIDVDEDYNKWKEDACNNFFSGSINLRLLVRY